MHDYETITFEQFEKILEKLHQKKVFAQLLSQSLNVDFYYPEFIFEFYNNFMFQFENEGNEFTYYSLSVHKDEIVKILRSPPLNNEEQIILFTNDGFKIIIECDC